MVGIGELGAATLLDGREAPEKRPRGILRIGALAEDVEGNCLVVATAAFFAGDLRIRRQRRAPV